MTRFGVKIRECYGSTEGNCGMGKKNYWKVSANFEACNNMASDMGLNSN